MQGIARQIPDRLTDHHFNLPPDTLSSTCIADIDIGPPHRLIILILRHFQRKLKGNIRHPLLVSIHFLRRNFGHKFLIHQRPVDLPNQRHIPQISYISRTLWKHNVPDMGRNLLQFLRFLRHRRQFILAQIGCLQLDCPQIMRTNHSRKRLSILIKNIHFPMIFKRPHQTHFTNPAPSPVLIQSRRYIICTLRHALMIIHADCQTYPLYSSLVNQTLQLF